MKLITWLLAPFSLIYYLLTRFRNHLYDIGYSKSFQFEVPTISIGNLSVGGTGKSPMVEYLVRLLCENFHVVTLSRGYGRKTRGFRITSSNDDSKSVGDEPYQFYRKFSGKIKVAVGEERALAIPEIIYHMPDTDLILMDDAFQHRSVVPHVSVLLTTYDRPFYNDWLLPSGRLREPRKGAERADVIIVTKCPADLNSVTMDEMELQIRNYSHEKCLIFFTGIKYGLPIPIWPDTHSEIGDEVFLFSAIANHSAFENYAREQFQLQGSYHFPDHHRFTVKDINSLIQRYSRLNLKNGFMLTTEKDMVKLLDPALKEAFQNVPVFYLPIETYFLKNGHIFDAEVKKRMDSLKYSGIG